MSKRCMISFSSLSFSLTLSYARAQRYQIHIFLVHCEVFNNIKKGNKKKSCSSRRHVREFSSSFISTGQENKKELSCASVERTLSCWFKCRLLGCCAVPEKSSRREREWYFFSTVINLLHKQTVQITHSCWLCMCCCLVFSHFHKSIFSMWKFDKC